jgi:hypothetical protein
MVDVLLVVLASYQLVSLVLIPDETHIQNSSVPADS